MVDPAMLGRRQAERRVMPLLRTMIGDALRRARLEQGRTLADVARAAKVSMPYLSELERGRKEGSSEILAAICAALGVELADLLAGVARRAATSGSGATARARAIGGSRAIVSGPAVLGGEVADKTGIGLTADQLGPAEVIQLGDVRDGRDQLAPSPLPLPAPPGGAGDAVCLLAA
jgi:transcriptional regulator with XRE-family HTH domain